MVTLLIVWARDGVFFRVFARLHPTLKFPHIALLAMGLVTAVACFFSLTTVINALIAQRPYRQWLYPVPSLIALLGWVYIFQASGWSAIRLMLGWTVLGLIAYLIWARVNRLWPFGEKRIVEEFLDEQRDARGQAQGRVVPTSAAADQPCPAAKRCGERFRTVARSMS